MIRATALPCGVAESRPVSVALSLSHLRLSLETLA